MSEKLEASIKTLARYEPDTVYIGTGEYVAECVRADDGDYYLAADVDAAIEALRAEANALREANAEMQKQMDRAWNDGFDFAMKVCGWHEGEDPSTEGLYVVRDSKGNIEVGMWYAKTTSGQPAEWSKEFRDVDRDNIVAWMMVPPNAELNGARRASDLSAELGAGG